MPIVYKTDILSALKEAGYNTNRIRKERLLSEGVLQSLRGQKYISMENLARVCSLLDCQPGDLIAFSREEAAKQGGCPRRGILAFLNEIRSFEALFSALLDDSRLSMKTNDCLNTLPVYFGKKSFSSALAVLGWRARSRNAPAQRKDGYKRQKSGNRSIWNGFRLIFTSSL